MSICIKFPIILFAIYNIIFADDDDILSDLKVPRTEPTESKLQTTPDDPIIIDSDSDCDSPPVKKPHSPAKCLVIKESQKEFPPTQVSDIQIIPNSQPLQVAPQVPLQVPQ